MTLTNTHRVSPFARLRWLVMLSLLLAFALGFGLQQTTSAQWQWLETLSDVDHKNVSADSHEPSPGLAVTADYGLADNPERPLLVMVDSRRQQGTFDLTLIRAPPPLTG